MHKYFEHVAVESEISVHNYAQISKQYGYM